MKKEDPIKNTVKAENVRPFGNWLETFLPRATQDVHIQKSFLGNLHDIS